MFDKIKSDMVKALKEKDKIRLSVIRMIKAAIDKERIDKKIEITDEVVIDVLAKELKTREESKTEFMKASRSDLVEQLDKEIEIIKEYLPEPLSEEEIDNIINDAISEIDATSIKDMGKVMKLITPKIKGRCDMKEISNKIKTKLS